MTKLFKILLIVWIGLLPLQSCAQKQKSVKKMQQEHFDRQAEQAKGVKKGQDKALERHLEIQTKQTKKRMKQTEKKSNRVKERRKEPLLKRWFTKKRR